MLHRGHRIVQDPVSKKVQKTNRRPPQRSEIAVAKARHRGILKVGNRFRREASEKMGHKEPEQVNDPAAQAEDSGHNKHNWESQIGTVYGARKAIEAARNLPEAQQEELFAAVEKKHPQILRTRRRF